MEECCGLADPRAVVKTFLLDEDSRASLSGLGFGVWGLGFGVWGLGFRVFGVCGLGFRGCVWVLSFSLQSTHSESEALSDQ